jgi:hypothetical protein
VTENGLKIRTLGYKLKLILLSTEEDFWKRVSMSSRLLKVKNKGLTEKKGVTQKFLDRLEKKC